jgi:WD40 repeat protein
LNAHKGSINALAFSPDGKWFVTGGEDRTVIVWDAVKFDMAAVLRGHQNTIGSVTFQVMDGY